LPFYYTIHYFRTSGITMRTINLKEAILTILAGTFVFAGIAYFDPAVNAGDIAQTMWSITVGFLAIYFMVGKEIKE